MKIWLTILIVVLSVTSVFSQTDIYIGTNDGNNNNKVVNGYYNYSKFQYIYHPDEIGNSGDIIKIAFNVAGWTYSNSDGVLENVVIKVGHTNLDFYSSSAYSNDPNTVVWSGTYDPELGWNEFQFNQAFAYNGVDNFIISIECTDGSWMGNPVPNFQYDAVSEYRSCRGYSDSSNPPNPYREKYLPVTRLTMGNLVPPLSISGVSTNTSCSNTVGGDIDITVSGGETPYSYSWSSGQTTEDIANLSGGLYTITVTDAAGRTSQKSFQISNDVSWEYLVGIENPNGDHSVLQKTIADSKYNNWARSANRLDGDGKLSFSIPAIGEYWTIGLSTQQHTEGNYNAIDFGWEMWGTSIWIDESGDSPDFLYPDAGDVMSVVRQGTKILYFHNETKLDHEGYVPAGESLYVEAVIDGQGEQITDISIDFCIPVVLSSTHVNVSEQAAGSIDLSVSGGLEPYTFSWNSGEQTEDISNLHPGVYAVMVTDARGETAQTSVKISNQIIWDYLVGIDVVNPNSGDELKKTAIDSRTNNWAVAKNILEGDGELKVTFEGPGDYWVIGLSTQKHTEGTFYASDFAIESYGSTMWISESGAFPWFTSITAGDEFTIRRIGSTIKYFFNGTDLNEDSYVPADEPLYLEAVIKNQYEAIENIEIDFGIPMKLSTTLSHPSKTQKGSISLNPTGGVAYYSYSWNNNSTNQNLADLNPGFYDVQITDALGQYLTEEFIIGYQVEWDTLIDIDTTLNNISHTSGTNKSTHAYSKNVSYSDGWISFIVNDNTDQWIVGLNDNQGSEGIYGNSGYSDILYAFELDQGNVWINENGSYLSSSPIQNGDQLSIRKQANQIDYYLNNQIIHSSIEANSTPLKIEASINQGVISNLRSSFLYFHLFVDAEKPADPNSKIPSLIKLSSIGSSGSVKYNWSSGQKTSFIKNISSGDYWVYAKDTLGNEDSIKFTVTEIPEFQENSNVSFENGKAFKKNGSNWNEAKLISANTLLSNEKFDLKPKINSLNEYRVGLKSTKNTSTLSDVYFGLEISQEEVYIISKGEKQTSLGSIKNKLSDDIAIKLVDNTLNILRNDTLILKDSIKYADTLKVALDIKNHDTHVELPISVKGNSNQVIEVQVYTEDPISLTNNVGSARVSVSGGTPRYSIMWPTGETTTSIENIPPGEYWVSVMDQNGSGQSVKFVIASYLDKLIDALSDGLSIDDQFTIDGSFNLKACEGRYVSKETRDANEFEFIQFFVDDPSYSILGGISNYRYATSNITYYQFYIEDSRLFVVESDSYGRWYRTYIGSVQEFDELYMSISPEDTIEFFQNSTKVHTSHITDSSSQFHLDFKLTESSRIMNIRTSFTN